MTDTDATVKSERVISCAEFMVPMRDGVLLATDVYGLDELQGPHPVILERTPYGKRESRGSDQARRDWLPEPSEIADYFVSRGYIVVRQDCRGRGRSQGEFVKYLGEGPDGVDALAWLAAQPWNNGAVLTTGVSYSAHVQAALGVEGAQHVAGMFLDSGGFSSAYEVGMRMGGAFEMKQATWAFNHARESPQVRADPVLQKQLDEIDLRDWFKRTPWRAGSSPLKYLPDYETYLLEQWAHEDFDEYWTQPGIHSRGRYDLFPDVPTYHVSSWYDPYIRSAIENFQELRSAKKSPTFLLLGPWTHGSRCRSFSGDVDFGPSAFFDGNLGESYLSYRADWFDAVIGRTDASDLTTQPAVRYFLMGGGSGAKTASGRLDHGGHWEDSAVWPPEDSRPLALYLGADQSLKTTSSAAGTISFQSDPDHPVPTVGGQVTSGEPVMHGGAFDQVENAGLFGCEPPYLPLESRKDVVTFRSEPLSEPFKIAGPVSVNLHFTCTTPDADIVVKLIDEYPPSEDYPAGYAMNLTEGILRLRYRDSYSAPNLMRPGVDYEAVVKAPDTANQFARGHRVRLDIAGSDFPRFDINQNTGGHVSDDRCSQIARVMLSVGGVNGCVLLVNQLNSGKATHDTDLASDVTDTATPALDLDPLCNPDRRR